MGTAVEIREISELNAAELEALAVLLRDVVADGGAIGFLPPVEREEGLTYWNGVLAPDVKLWVAEEAGEIVGTVQLHLSTKKNGLHRAEIAKMMVHPNSRRKGIARRLMLTAEQGAVHEDRTLLVLDTREGDPSNDLYRSLGFVEVGRIPNYAKSADGSMHSTVYYYKELNASS